MKPISRAETAWTYCDRCRPDGAEPIQPDEPYYVTRLEFQVVLTGAPGNRAAAAEEAVRRITYAIESVGGLVVALQVPGAEASAAAATAPPLRLQLAGHSEPAGEWRSRVLGARSEPRVWRWGRRRA